LQAEIKKYFILHNSPWGDSTITPPLG